MLVLQTYCGFFFAWWGIKEHKTHLIMLLLHIWLRILMDFQTRQKKYPIYYIPRYIRINTANYKVLFFRSVSLYMSYQCPEVFMTE